MCVIICLFFLSCNGQSTKSSKIVNEVQIDSLPKIQNNGLGESEFLLPLNMDSISNGNYLRTTFINYYQNLQPSDFRTIQFLDSLTVHHFGKTLIYKISFSNELPESVQKVNYLIVNPVSKLGSILLVDTIIPIKISSKYDTVLLSGMKIYKGIGHLSIYEFMGNDTLKEIFNTSNSSNKSMPIYDASDACVSYLPNLLYHRSADINNDGIMDISFYGSIAYYCEGLELGHSQYDRKPLKIKPINFSIMLRRSIDNHFLPLLVFKK